MRRNMVASLFEHETIATTIQKAKEVKPFAEKLITLAKKGTLSARRRAISMLGNRDIIEHEDGERVRKGTVVGKLFSEIGPRYLDRPGGYTRIIRRSLRRLGDNGELVLLQLLGENEGPKKKAKAAAKKRSPSKRKDTAKVAGPEALEPEKVAEVETAAEVEVATAVEEATASEEKAQVKQPDEAGESQNVSSADVKGADEEK